MKKVWAALCAAIVAVCCAAGLVGCADAQKLPDEKTLDLSDYQLTFSDDFDTLDKTVWQTGRGESFVRHGAYYTDDEYHLFIRDGKLVIRTDYRTGSRGEGWYTSWLESASAVRFGRAVPDDYRGFSQVYGYFEARCKAPRAVGIWSAFWLMPDGAKGMSADDELGTGADGVEIDIMESPWVYSATPEANVHVVHGDGYKDTKTDRSPKYEVPGMYDAFHDYGVLWTEDEYIFYIDGRETWRSRHTADGAELGVSRVDQYPIFSVEVSGKDGKEGKSWCGDPAKNDKSKAYDFEVEYIKVYSLSS